MRNFWLVVIQAFVLVVAFDLGAEIKKAELERPVALTQEALLLQQVDTVSLYLSSEKVAFAPKLSKDRVIEVEMTLLDPALVSKAGASGSYVSRLVDTFISTLKGRLPNYAPSIAKGFDSAKDIAFVVNSGAARTPLGTWKGGVWVWAVAGSQALAVSSPNLVSAEALPTKAGADQTKDAPKKKGCDCPAMR